MQILHSALWTEVDMNSKGIVELLHTRTDVVLSKKFLLGSL